LGFVEEKCGVAASVFSRQLNYFDKFSCITFLQFLRTVLGFSEREDLKSIWQRIYLQGFAKAIARKPAPNIESVINLQI
jgi:hypothetical protein